MARTRPRDDDDDDDDEIPTPSKKKKKNREPERSSNLMPWAIGALGMIFLVLAVLVVVAVTRKKGGDTATSPAPAPADKMNTPGAPRSLQGTWEMVSLEQKNRKQTWGVNDRSRITIAGNTMTSFFSDGEKSVSDMKVDSTRTPMELDVITQGLVYRAIYKIEGDTLLICINESGRPRPREFNGALTTGSGGLTTYKFVE